MLLSQRGVGRGGGRVVGKGRGVRRPRGGAGAAPAVTARRSPGYTRRGGTRRSVGIPSRTSKVVWFVPSWAILGDCRNHVNSPVVSSAPTPGESSKSPGPSLTRVRSHPRPNIGQRPLAPVASADRPSMKIRGSEKKWAAQVASGAAGTPVQTRSHRRCGLLVPDLLRSLTKPSGSLWPWERWYRV